MKLRFFLTAFARSSGELISRKRVAATEEILCQALRFPPGTDLTGEFPIDRNAGLALRRQGLDLDLRKADYFLGSEASNEDVRQAVEALTVSSKPSTIKPVSKGLSSRRVEIDTNVPAYVRRSGLGTYAGKQAVYAKAAAKKAAAKKAAAKKAPARKAAAKKAPARKAAAKKFA